MTQTCMGIYVVDALGGIAACLLPVQLLLAVLVSFLRRGVSYLRVFCLLHG